MGYMGFGMAKWVYKQRPKKAFAKSAGKPSCNVLTDYKRKFKLKPSNTFGRRKLNFEIIIVLATVLFFTFLLFKFDNYESNIVKAKHQSAIIKDEMIFNYLLDSGIYHLEHNNYENALSEFILAEKINPEDKKLHRLMTEVYYVLCESESRHCAELERK